MAPGPCVCLLLALAAQMQVQAQVRAEPSEEVVFKFGARGPKDTELYRQVVNKRIGIFGSGTETVRYPPVGSTQNVVTQVEVHTPRRLLLQDEVRVTSGGPGMSHVTLSIGGSWSLNREYTLVVYGNVVGTAIPTKMQVQTTHRLAKKMTTAPTYDEDYPVEELSDYEAEGTTEEASDPELLARGRRPAGRMWRPTRTTANSTTPLKRTTPTPTKTRKA